MIIDRYLIREVATTLLGVTLVLTLISVTGQLASIFAQVASGALLVDTVLIMMWLEVISAMVFILPLSLYLAILLAFSRLYADSEMVILTACGMGKFRVLRAVLGLAIFFTIIQLSVSLIFAPWAEERIQEITAKVEASSDVKGLIPGRFNEMGEGIGVIYVQELDDEKKHLKNVFVQQHSQGSLSIISSASGFQKMDEKTGDKFILLDNGYRYEGRPGQKDYAIISFAQHGIRIGEHNATRFRRKDKSIPTKILWRSKNNGEKAELQARISSALLSLVLTLLAVPLSRTSPRQGRYSKLAIALLIYITYTNLLNVARAWLAKGDISPELGLWWVHVVMAAVGLYLLARQSGIKHMFRKQPVID